MSLLTQFQCLIYCFVYGFVFSGIYHVFNRLLYGLHVSLKIVLQVMAGVCFAYCFYVGLIYLNNGVMSLYFFIFVFVGYAFFQRHYSHILLFYLEKCARIYRRIIRPYIFFFRKIGAIMVKKEKWVKKKWQKRKNSNSKN